MKKLFIYFSLSLVLFSCKLNEDERISSRIHGIYTITKIEQSGDVSLNLSETDSVGELAFKYEGNNLTRLNPGEVAINARFTDKLGFFNAMKKKSNFYWVWKDGYLDCEVASNAILPPVFRLDIELNKPKRKILKFEGSFTNSQNETVNVIERIFLELKKI
jgi:hypothetical protein